MTEFYQLGDDAAFERCLPDTLKEEGGYSNDKHDRGGATMEGVTQREYDRWRIARALPTRWVEKIGNDEVRTIYHDDYWLPHCPKLPAGLDLCVFDTNVNNGVHPGVILLQRALGGVTVDGIFGDETAAAILRLKVDAKALHLAIARFYRVRRAYYLSLNDARYFARDWLHRDLDIEREAFAMAGKPA